MHSICARARVCVCVCVCVCARTYILRVYRNARGFSLLLATVIICGLSASSHAVALYEFKAGKKKEKESKGLRERDNETCIKYLVTRGISIMSSAY